MTNLWHGVKPDEFCDQHLLGVHKECHQAAGSIRAGNRLGRSGRYVDPGRILERHAEVAGEMVRREMNHESPMKPFPEYKRREGDHWPLSPLKIRERLRLRCERCAGRMQEDPDRRLFLLIRQRYTGREIHRFEFRDSQGLVDATFTAAATAQVREDRGGTQIVAAESVGRKPAARIGPPVDADAPDFEDRVAELLLFTRGQLPSAEVPA